MYKKSAVKKHSKLEVNGDITTGGYLMQPDCIAESFLIMLQ